MSLLLMAVVLMSLLMRNGGAINPGEELLVLNSSAAVSWTWKSSSGLDNNVGPTSTASLGDVDGDSIDDFALCFRSSSVVLVFWGKSDVTTPYPSLSQMPNITQGLTLYGTIPSSSFARAVVGCNVNGDAYSDIIISGNVSVVVVLGRATGWPSLGVIHSSDLWATSSGLGFTISATGLATASPEFGSTLLCAGDYNRDGVKDFIIGDPQAGKGTAVLFYGRKQWATHLVYSAGNWNATSAIGFTTTSLTDSVQIGSSFASLDLNLDDRLDLVFGAPTGSNNGGHVFVYLGSAATLSSSSLLPPSSSRGYWFKGLSGDFFGQSLATGDINGDNHTDLVIGCPGASKVVVLVATKGMVYTSSQTSFSNSVTVQFSAVSSSDFGGSLATGDVNGDDHVDVLIGAPLIDRVVLFYGSTQLTSLAIVSLTPAGSSQWSVISSSSNSDFGYSISTLIGLTNQPLSLLIGAPQESSVKLISCGSYCLDSSCSQCSIGFAPTADSCVPCSSGSFSFGDSSCQPTSGCTNVSETGHCLHCAVSFGLLFGHCFACSSHCLTCQPLNNMTCTQCISGMMPLDHTPTCTPCTGNTYSPSGVSCFKGAVNCLQSNHITGDCVTCSAGFQVNRTTGKCVACVGNTYSDDGVSCQQGQLNCVTSNHTVKECSSCSAGYEIGVAGDCIQCSGNSFSANGITCDTGPGHCEECNSITGKCTQCSVSYGLSKSTGTCIACSGNYWSNGTVVCQPGHDSHCALCDHSSGVCIKCTAGFGFNTTTANSSCLQCTGNMYSDGSVSCHMTSMTNCITCDHTDGNCVLCKIGYGIVPSNGSCTVCTGSLYSVGSTPCLEGPTNCLTSNHTSFTCAQCVTGYHIESTTGTCFADASAAKSSGGVSITTVGIVVGIGAGVVVVFIVLTVGVLLIVRKRRKAFEISDSNEYFNDSMSDLGNGLDREHTTDDIIFTNGGKRPVDEDDEPPSVTIQATIIPIEFVPSDSKAPQQHTSVEDFSEDNQTSKATPSPPPSSDEIEDKMKREGQRRKKQSAVEMDESEFDLSTFNEIAVVASSSPTISKVLSHNMKPLQPVRTITPRPFKDASQLRKKISPESSNQNYLN